MKIVGNTVGMGLPKPNLKQTDPRKGDFVKGKDEIPTKVSQLENDSGFLTSAPVTSVNGMTGDVVISGGSGGGQTEMVLSDNLFDKSAAVEGKVFYYSSSGLQLADSSWSCYAYVPLRGPGTYRTKWNNNQHSSTTNRVGITKEDNSWLQTINGTLTATDNAQAYDMEFVITQAMINNGAAKIAFDCAPDLLDTVMIVKDREYPDEYIPYGYIEVVTEDAKKQDNILCGKIAVFLGDSICAGTTVEGDYYNYGWAGLIGESNKMNWTNYGMNGGTITSLSGVQNTRWLTTQADKALSEHPAADYVIFEGGCNDADQMKDALLGTISSDYATFDTTTFSGAFEALVLKLVTSFPTAKIGYIIPQKMYAQNDHTAKGHVHRRFFDRAIEICEKWGIPYIDLWNGSHLNPKLSTASTFYTDGQHLTLAGYQVITPQIESWMRNMWVTGTSAGRSSGGNVDLTGVVKSVNGKTPDENGNVQIAIGGGSVGAAPISALTMQVVGQLFAKPEGRKYVAWPLGSVQYDPNDDTVNVLVNVADTHDMTNDENRPDLYLCKINPRTLDYAMVEVVKDSAVVNQTNADTVTFVPGTKDAYTYGLCIDSDGDYLFMPNYTSEAYLFRSKDHGASWSVTVCNMPGRNDTSFTGLMQTHTGRLIVSTHSSYFWYSDDNGVNWTKCATPTTHSYGHEACIVELAEGELIAVMRKRWQSTDNNGWNGVRQIDPAFICYSHDNGETWTNGVDSTTITEMSATGCAIAKIGDRLELYATSRYPHLDTMGVIYQHAASVEDAMVDNWSNGKVLTYSKAKKYDDFGYPGCCVDANGNVHLFWYDGDADESGNTNYYYAQGYSGVSGIPVNADGLAVVSPSLPYSAAMVKQLIDSAVTKLNAKINQIIIDGGGTPDDGDSYFVVDGLYEYVDFLNESKYDASTYTYSGSRGKFGIVADQNKPAEFSTKGLYQTGYQKTDLSSELSLADGVTFEVEVWTGEGVAVNSTAQVIAIGVTNNVYGIPGVRQAAAIDWKYVNTSGATIANVRSSTTWKDPIYAANTYRHVVLTVTSTELVAYVEGGAVSIVDSSEFNDFASFVCDLSKFSINGSWNATDNYAQCLRVYNRALTADEVKQNFNYQKSMRE